MVATSRNRRQLTRFFLLSVVPILLFFYVFFQFIGNIPFQDDYDALLEPVTKFVQMPTFSWDEFVKIIWTQDDERRIVVDRLVAILNNSLVGTLDLRLQAFLGLLSLLGIFYLFYRIIRGAQLPAELVLTCALFLFHIQYYETIFWAMIPLQHVVVYFFALLSFYYLYSAKPFQLILSLAIAILAILSDVSGTFVLPAGLVLLGLQRRWRDGIVWALVIGSVVLLYYYNFTVPSFRPKFSDNLQHPDFIIGRILTISGVSFDLNTVLPPTLRIGLVMLVGLVLWGIVVYYGIGLLKKAFTTSNWRFNQWESTLWGGLFQFSITLLALAVGRAVEGIEPLLISRYKHIGFIWLILVLLLVMSQIRPTFQHRFSRIAMGVSVGIFLFSYFQYLAPLNYYYKERYTDMYGWEKNRAIPSSPIYISVRPAVDSITVQAIRAGVYRLPDHYFFEGPYVQKADTVSLKIEHIGGHTLSFINDSFSSTTGKNDGAFVLLKSATQQHIIPVNQNRYSLKSFLFSLGKNYYAPGFTSTLTSKYLLDNQTYQVLILVMDEKGKTVHPTPYEIQINQGVVRIVPTASVGTILS